MRRPFFSGGTAPALHTADTARAMADWFQVLTGALEEGASAAAASTAQTYVELTLVLLASLLTCMLVVRALPYITSSVVFFVKFCACAVVLSVCLHLIENSAVVRAVRPLLKAGLF